MPIIIVTGTPGTGKTTVSRILSKNLSIPLVEVNKLVEEKHIYHGYNREKGYKEVDLVDLDTELEQLIANSDEDGLIIEGHLAHQIKNLKEIDHIIVLRARPDILRKRLNTRNWPESKIQENIEAEALDICTYEAVENHDKKVNELNTTDLNLENVVDQIMEVVNGEKYFPPGRVDFLEFMYSL